MVTKYGYSVILSAMGLTTALLVISLSLIESGIVRGVLLVFASLLLFFVLYFFRDPARTIPLGEHLILSPADGKVVTLHDVVEEMFLRAPAKQISIFLSPFDVHVNRIPITGRVRFLEYVRGEYLVAFDEKASEKNERTMIGIENGKVKVLVRQVAGFIARRIVCDLRLEEDVTAGERFGMIKFGSRVDVLIPSDANINVCIGERVIAGETVLATLNA